jgi:arsenate reductase-like glutaredoxin family protein
LREKGVEVDEVNYAKSGLDEAALRGIVEAAGSVAAVLNTRHAVAKERAWVERPPDVATFVRAAVADPNLLRRPILIRGKKILVGYDKTTRPAWDALA